MQYTLVVSGFYIKRRVVGKLRELSLVSYTGTGLSDSFAPHYLLPRTASAQIGMDWPIYIGQILFTTKPFLSTKSLNFIVNQFRLDFDPS